MARTFITISGVHKAYGNRVILEDASVAIQEDHKIGVVGRNGAGKSTMCKMILGEEQPDAGRLSLHDEMTLSYLEQKDPFAPGESVLDFLMRYSGREEWRCGKLAGRFLLGQDLLPRAIDGLSGGYQTRVKLCAMLLREPNFLILDEPTNYLDLRTLMLLEQFLCSYDGGFLIVSHDREFLKRTCRQTIEVESGKITFYPGTVEEWFGYKEERRVQAEKANANVAARAKELQDFIDRNRAKASKATQAQSKMKMLDRLETITIEHKLATVAIAIPPIEERQGSAVRLHDLAIGYPDKTIATGIELDLERGKKIAVLGDNGQGKSTFLKTLAGSLPAKRGEIKWGHGIRVGHYAQHVYAAIPGDQTVQRYLERCATSAPGHVTTQQVLDLAGSLLFRGDDVQKRVSVLSGGERSRLCLAGLLLSKFPVLLLDEPTNHLDFETVEALADALKAYNGTVFLVSHDRTFVHVVATDIVEVRDGKVTLYGDGYDAYCWRVEQEVRAESNAADAAKPGTASVKKAKVDQQQRGTQAKAKLKSVERDLAKLEQEKTMLIERMAKDPARHAASDGPRLQGVVARIAELEAQWLDATNEMEASGG
jgi:ATP-binding cassette subfamily F protein 3